jgi:outer membrane lipoprotein SlyB
VTRIDRVQVAAIRSSGAGTLIGAVVGAVIGHQIESRNCKEDEVYRIGVRLENGEVRQFDYRKLNALRAGDRVKLEGGQLYRL